MTHENAVTCDGYCASVGPPPSGNAAPEQLGLQPKNIDA